MWRRKRSFYVKGILEVNFDQSGEALLICCWYINLITCVKYGSNSVHQFESSVGSGSYSLVAVYPQWVDPVNLSSQRLSNWFGVYSFIR